MHEKLFGLDREPTYRFKVGDKVQKGNAIVTVLAVSDDYKKYVVASDSKNRSNAYWHELRRTDKTPAVPTSYLTKNQDVKLRFSNQELSSLIHTYYSFGIDDTPDYQRGDEWSLADKQRLIESIFMGADIGRFLLNERDEIEVDEPIYEIVDGKQRLRAIIDFYEDRFTFEGYTFSMLSKNDARTFLRHDISVGKLLNANRKTVLKCFLMTNRGGVPVDEEHLKRIEFRLACMELNGDL